MSSLSSILNPEAQSKFIKNLSLPPSLEQTEGKSIQNKTPSPPSNPSRTTSPGASSSHSSTPVGPQHTPHENCPDNLDCLPDTDGRPQHTLPIILRCAILGSTKKRLTIRDIYAAMEKKYPYYRTAGPTWKQSVRHHLSLNRLFERQARPVHDPGFGSYWTVNLDAPPGTKRPRKRGRQTKGFEVEEIRNEHIGTIRTRLKDHSCDNELGLPSITNLTLPSGGSTSSSLQLQRITSSYMTSQDGSVDDIDSEENTYSRARVVNLSDDAYDTDDDVEHDTRIWTRPIGHSSGPSSPRIISAHSSRTAAYAGEIGYFDAMVGQMRGEIRELKRQNSMVSSVSARISDELAQAHAEIARLRAKNEFLERRLEFETSRRLG